MTNRREFLQAAAVSALPVVAGATSMVGAVQINTSVPIALHTVLVDGRYAESRSVGARLARAGVTARTIPDGDITQLWVRHIGPAWRHQPVAVAGLTARPALFCLEQLALAYGLRVVFHSEHVAHSGGRTEHWVLRGAESADLSTPDLMRAGPLWPDRIADAIVNHCKQERCARFGPSDAALEPALPTGSQLLTSWIIAAV